MSLTLRRGDDHRIFGTVRLRPPEVPGPVDITDWDIWFTLKRRWPDGDEVALLKKQTGGAGIEITDAPAGKFTISIDKVDLAAIPNAERTLFLYDVQIKDRFLRVRTIGQDACCVLGDVTFVS